MAKSGAIFKKLKKLLKRFRILTQNTEIDNIFLFECSSWAV